MKSITDNVREFIIENFLFGQGDDLQDEASFLEEGIIDSTGVLELVSYIEEKFSIKVEDEELIPENLDSINSVARFVEGKTSSTESA